MEVDDEGGAHLPHTALHLTHVEVDVDGLADFRALLGRELDTNLRPAVDGINSDHFMGVGFGHANPGAQVRQAQQRYHQVLESSTKTLATYLAIAESLNAAMARIADKYRDADLTSAAMTNTVLTELRTAAVQANESILKAELEKQHETQRQQNRLNAGRL